MPKKLNLKNLLIAYYVYYLNNIRQWLVNTLKFTFNGYLAGLE